MYMSGRTSPSSRSQLRRQTSRRQGKGFSLLPLLPIALALGCTANPNKDAGEPVEGAISSQRPASLPPQALRLTDDEAIARAPVQLTASDGTGLRLVSMKARAVIDAPLAFTELHLTFENPSDRQIEGRFEIEMPPHAAISRFAMKVHGSWQEGEVVERQAARVAYEDFLHRKQDPALLENNAGNSFSARVFPIAPRERKELIVSYSQELPSSAEPYRLMLRGLPELDELDARVLLWVADAGGGSNIGGTSTKTRVVEVKKSKYTPERDLEVSLENVRARMTGLRHQNLAVARIAPVGAMPPAPLEKVTILFDTSASRALGFERQIRRMRAILEELRGREGTDFDLRIICFDQTTSEVYRGKASALAQSHLDRIVSRRALGASDLEAALRAVAADAAGSTRLIVFSDGIVTAGSPELSRLGEATKALAAAGFTRADAVVDGGIQDTSTLKAVTTADLPEDGVVIDARLPTSTIAHKLGSKTLPPIKVSVPGSEWVWPETIEGAQPGDELLVFADLPATQVMKVRLEGGSTIESVVPTTEAERPLLERAWVRARIERLEDKRSRLPEGDRDMRDAIKKSIIELSTKHRVLSDFTALLVLESESDYQRFNIDRKALVDILSVGPNGITRDGRSLAPTTQLALHSSPMQQQNLRPSSQHSGPATPNDDNDVWGGLLGSEVGEAFGVGGLGLVGTGRGGGGTGEGTIGLGSIGLIGKGGGGGSGAYGSGVLGVLQDQDADVWSDLTGNMVGEAYGIGGLDLSGTAYAYDGVAENDDKKKSEVEKEVRKPSRRPKSGTGSGYGRGHGRGIGSRPSTVPRVRQGKATVRGALDRDIIRRIVRSHINEIRYCYERKLVQDPSLAGNVTVNFVINSEGDVTSSKVTSTTIRDRQVSTCVANRVLRWRFPDPAGGGIVSVTYPFVFAPNQNAMRASAPPLSPKQIAERDAEFKRQQAAAERRRIEAEAEAKRLAAAQAEEQAELTRTEGSPYLGRSFDIAKLITEGKFTEAMKIAIEWRAENPGDVLALVAMGETAEAAGDLETAARAYGSLIDLFPSRADLRRYAGNHLDRLGEAGSELAIDTYNKAVLSRPDHPASHRLYAFALTKAGRHSDAWEAILAGRSRSYPSGRFAGVDAIFDDDAGLIAAAWIRANPTESPKIHELATTAGVTIPKVPSTHFVITWETDANDVDFHVHDGKGSHAYFGARTLPSGGELYADVTTGYGPESFTIKGNATAYPYRLEAHYYSRGPMGYGMGKLQVIQHDGKGGLRFDERPFLIMKDGAFVPLGTVDKPL